MINRNAILISLVILSIPGFMASQIDISHSPVTILPYLPKPPENQASLILELDRAILVLKRGQEKKWSTRDRYLKAFDKSPNTGPAGEAIPNAKDFVRSEISGHLPIHQIWDESLPIGVEVGRTIVEFTEQRNQLLAQKGQTH